MKSTVLYTWWLRHRTGGLAPHRNPLCRTSDRLQQFSAWTCFLVAVVAIPLASVTVLPAIAFGWMPQPMQPTNAVVQHVSQAPLVLAPRAEYVAPTYDVRVRWTTESGVARDASIRTAERPHSGATVRIWATASGDTIAVSAPVDTVAMNVVFLVINAALAICLVSYGVHRLLVWRLDRYRLRAWDAELSQLLARH